MNLSTGRLQQSEEEMRGWEKGGAGMVDLEDCSHSLCNRVATVEELDQRYMLMPAKASHLHWFHSRLTD